MTAPSTPDQIEVIQCQTGYKVGDLVSMKLQRDWLAIWCDRIRLMRWDVPQTELRWFRCTSTSPGSMWPEVDE